MPEMNIDPERIRAIVEDSGLHLSEPYFQELMDVYPYLAPMLARIRQDRDGLGEPAHLFAPLCLAAAQPPRKA